MPSVQTGSLNSDARRKEGISVIQVGKLNIQSLFSWKGVAGGERSGWWGLHQWGLGKI